MQERDKLIGTGETKSSIPDKNACREYWLDVVKPVAMQGRLDAVKATPAKNLREKSQAKTQNHWLSRRSYGFPDNDWYERVKWNKKTS